MVSVTSQATLTAAIVVYEARKTKGLKKNGVAADTTPSIRVP